MISIVQEYRRSKSPSMVYGMDWAPRRRPAIPRVAHTEAPNQGRNSEHDEIVKDVELAVIPTPSPRYVEKVYPISSLSIVGINGQQESGVGPPGLYLFGSHQDQNKRLAAFL